MFGVISGAAERLKQSWQAELDDDAIRRAGVEAGHVWRERKLDPVTTMKLLLLQILWGNAACNQQSHLAKQDFTGSGCCEARRRLPLEALPTLLTRATTEMAECVRETGRWLGHRLFITAGSTFSIVPYGAAA